MTLRRIFCSFVGSKKKVEDTIVALALSKENFESGLEKLPNKEDFEQVASYPENIIPKINDELVNVMHKLRLCEKEFLEKDINLNSIEEKLVCVSDLLRKNPSFKHVKEVPVKKQVWIKKERKFEEVKMLSEVKEPFVDLEKCSLHELISILHKFASDPSVNINQAGFGSYIANHALKEKIARYNQEAMIPPKLGDLWILKVSVTIGKETHHAILDLGSSVSILSKELYEVLELKNIEKCSIELALADDSIRHALGKVSDEIGRAHV